MDGLVSARGGDDIGPEESNSDDDGVEGGSGVEEDGADSRRLVLLSARAGLGSTL